MKTKLFLTVVIGIAFFLSSCGPSREVQREEIEKEMKGWVGKSETELVAKWGPPSNIYKLSDGAREITFVHRHEYPGYWGYRNYRTERGFTIDKTGTITAYRWDGF